MIISYGLLALSTQTCLIAAELDLHNATVQKFLYEMLNITPLRDANN